MVWNVVFEEVYRERAASKASDLRMLNLNQGRELWQNAMFTSRVLRAGPGE